ncbi:MAG: hypothetical protein OSJ72_13645 [Lachnospiraceae bacterium]|nr:hypothetical protein [Lachnospiraceae bacterium]
MGKIMLYHVSSNSGLKILYPHVSSHQQAYVYAIESLSTGLLFGAKMDDFDLDISTDNNGLTTVYECYPDAFSNVYREKSCSVYEVDDEGFKRGLTSWSDEWVCDTEVAVKNEIVIDDLYERLLKEEQLGNIKIFRYEFNNDYRRKIAAHIVDRLIRFHIDLHDCIKYDIRFATYYKEIIRELLTVMDGHLLQ